MLTHNYHTHTFRCHHATGTEREYIEKAIASGVRVLGFSDHSPYSFEGDYYSSFRMLPKELDDYVDTLTRLGREYARDIELHIGLEAEYYPGRWSEFLNMIQPYPIEYLLLGQHFLGDEIGEDGATKPTLDENRLIRFVNQVSEGIMTGKFACVAHPDILRFEGDETIYAREMRRLCECAKRADVSLELNFLGLRTSRHYPRAGFWEIAGEVGNDVIFGLDAHDTMAMGDTESYKTALIMAREYGLNVVDALRLG